MADDAEKKINRDRGIVAVKQNHKTFIRIAIPGLFSQENQSIFSDEIEEITKEALNMSQQGIIASLEGMKKRAERTFLLDQDDFPILMIIGKKDPALDFNSLLAQAKKGHVQSVIFEDGHMSHIENKKELIEVLSKWLSPRTTKKLQ
jgi:pimeloyl-ACP methyl ester carboxylesterase